MSGKAYRESLKKVDREKRYNLDEALDLVIQCKSGKFDETVDLAINLGVDSKQSDQMVRGAVPLPHGLGKTVRVLVFAKGEKEKEAQAAGADFVGSDDLVNKVLTENWLDFDKVIATPDMMGLVSKIGRILGPRGLMPNPKTGTVTFEVGKAVAEQKAGSVQFKLDKAGIVHAPIGKVSFGAGKLKDNAKTLMEAVLRAKPNTSKGTYLKAITVSSTMGPGIKLDTGSVSDSSAAA